MSYNAPTLPEKFRLASFILPSIIFSEFYEEAPDILIEKTEHLKFIKMPEDAFGLVIKTLPQNPPVFEKSIDIGFKTIKIGLEDFTNATASEKLRIVFGNAISLCEETEEKDPSNLNDQKQFKYRVTQPNGNNIFCKEEVIVLDPKCNFERVIFVKPEVKLG